MKLAEHESNQSRKKNKPLRAIALCRHCGAWRPGASPNKKSSPYCLACAMMENYIATTCKREAKEMNESKDYRRKIAKEIIESALARIPKEAKKTLPLKVPVRGKPMSLTEIEETKVAARETARKALARVETKMRLQRHEETKHKEQAKALGYYRVGQ